ncbi:quinol:cytochrome C oxidoreductase, partial [Lutibacter sp.]|uniref:quinol:cytochrome C oxidoreductase n=1 Tax=Lutibacter sp. TaxID=1925666 RepID=UPI0034A09A83
AIQHASQAGWPVVLFRVMEAITAYLPIGGILLFVFFVLSSLHLNHLFIWMDPEVVAHDELIQNKTGYLNVPFFLIRAAIYMAGWIWYRQHSRKLTLAQDNATDLSNYTKLFKRSAAFLVFFLVTESMMSWDWIMSLDPHWFSTLFGWYLFASMIVSAITTIALVSIYLKGKGYLEFVNNSHLHDLAKFMFGFSIFWTYLWFSQFMLIWYANIPEEVTYFVTRFNDYKIPFLGMLVLNFVFPLLVLMNSDYKRVNWFIVTTGIVILIGHYVDIFVMIMPATVGDQWYFGISEISSALLVLGIFIYVVFNALSKAPLLAKGSPFIKESEHFHY